jgi:hypothetical protein
MCLTKLFTNILICIIEPCFEDLKLYKSVLEILFVNIFTYILEPCFKDLKLVHECVWNMIEKYFSQIFLPTYLNHVPNTPNVSYYDRFKPCFIKKQVEVFQYHVSNVLTSCYWCWHVLRYYLVHVFKRCH